MDCKLIVLKSFPLANLKLYPDIHLSQIYELKLIVVDLIKQQQTSIPLSKDVLLRTDYTK